MIVLQTSKKRPYLLLVAPRIETRWSSVSVRDFRFTVLHLDLDEKGQGDGQIYSTAKLRFRNHELEIEDYGSKPELIRQVRLEQPTERGPVPSVRAKNGAIPAAPAVTQSSTGLSTQNAQARDVQAQAAITPTFHAQARLVQVDVSVSDSQGAPVNGLAVSDFTVLEDGKPQNIRVFESHVPLPNASQPLPAASLPPHTFSNRVVASGDDALSILLLDLMNTPVTDQAYARKQTIDFLETLPPGKRIAMF
ncbi:MAG: hypothetical protein C5B58_10690, partial [Acidobacteria bacterium]